MQDAGVIDVEGGRQVVAATETAVEGAGGGSGVVKRVAESLQGQPRVEALRRRAVTGAGPDAETCFGQPLPREIAAGVLLAGRRQIGVGDDLGARDVKTGAQII